VVGQINKQDAAVVAPVSKPAGQADLRVKMTRPQLSASMSSISVHFSHDTLAEQFFLTDIPLFFGSHVAQYELAGFQFFLTDNQCELGFELVR
jgi:hypothetical protein